MREDRAIASGNFVRRSAVLHGAAAGFRRFREPRLATQKTGFAASRSFACTARRKLDVARAI